MNDYEKAEDKTDFTFNSDSFSVYFLCLLERERGGGGGRINWRPEG